MVNEKRISRLLELMRQEGISVFMIGPSEHLQFLINLSTGSCERFQGFFLLDNGGYFYISPQLYYGEVKEALPEERIYVWKDREGYTGVMEEAVIEYNLAGRKIAVDNTIKAANLLEIARLCRGEFVNGTAVLEELRIVKNDEELSCLKTAAKMADEIMGKTIQVIKPGISEQMIKEKIKEFAREVGAEGLAFEPIAASGPNSSKPHYNKGERVIQEKDIIILDLGCKYRGYCSDISRTVFVGDITDREKEIYNIVREANSRAEERVAAGVTAQEIDQTARNIIERAGYGDYFLNRTGHGIGISVHEAPYIRTGNERAVEKGMAFSIEPGIYLPGEFGMRIEDIIVLTAAGPEVINDFPRDIIIK